MKIYIKAYWFDDDNESIDDFIYGNKPHEDSNYADALYEVLPDDPYEDNSGYSDFDEYDTYGYSEYEDFYKYIKRRKIYVPERVARDIPDYNAYRKGLFGTLYLSMQSGESIETLYSDICRNFPGIVKDSAMSQSDMLIELIEATLYAQHLLNAR